jgi:hypothetical protein
MQYSPPGPPKIQCISYLYAVYTMYPVPPTRTQHKYPDPPSFSAPIRSAPPQLRTRRQLYAVPPVSRKFSASYTLTQCSQCTRSPPNSMHLIPVRSVRSAPGPPRIQCISYLYVVYTVHPVSPKLSASGTRTQYRQCTQSLPNPNFSASHTPTQSTQCPRSPQIQCISYSFAVYAVQIILCTSM